jgi:hypothetical protein
MVSSEFILSVSKETMERFILRPGYFGQELSTGLRMSVTNEVGMKSPQLLSK